MDGTGGQFLYDPAQAVLPDAGGFVQIAEFDAGTDALVVEVPEGEDVHVLAASRISGSTVIALSNGVRVVLEGVTELRQPAESYITFVEM